MSHRDERRGSLAPEANGRAALSVPPMRAEPVHEKPAKHALECMRHDARSARHALSGFVELLAVEALGPMTEDQQGALVHVQASAQRLFELIETALELTQGKQPFAISELRSSPLSQLTTSVVRNLSYERPDLQLTLLPATLEAELPVSVEPEVFNRVLRILIDAIAGHGALGLSVSFSQTDLHASVVLSAQRGQPDAADARTRKPSSKSAANADLEAMADAWDNPSYIRLKRCEALLARQQGRLLVTPDLGRVRIMLPVQRGL